MILGIDEVGRGPWAGPLVVGAVVLSGEPIENLTDSKLLSKTRRESMHEEILSSGAAIGLGWVHAAELDEFGLSRSLVEATKRAVKQITTPYHDIIIDGTVNFLKDTPLGPHATTIKKADRLIPSVSAASIVAKVVRDEYMRAQAELFPRYGFERHVGYGTAAHRAAIKEYGLTPLHRRSFGPLRSIDTVTDQPVVKNNTTKLGNDGESAVCDYLTRRGYVVIERNWKTKLCEIDIVARKNETYYFIEVKHRTSASHGDGLAAITPKKHRQMTFAARLYEQFNKLDAPLRLAAAATAGQPAEVISYVEIE